MWDIVLDARNTLLNTIGILTTLMEYAVFWRREKDTHMKQMNTQTTYVVFLLKLFRLTLIMRK